MPFTPAPAELESAIRSLKKELNAVILAHYYQESEIQDVADFIGDSLALAQEAAKTKADVIVFCGVHFMAETAKILNPTSQVLLPDLKAGCSLADRTPPAAFTAFKAKHPGAFVVSYVNSSAAVKAMSDVICTSSNAVKIVEQGPEGPADHLRAGPAPRPLRAEADRPRDDPLAGQLHRPRDLQREAAGPAEGRSTPTRRWSRTPSARSAVLRHADYIGSTKGILEHVIREPEARVHRGDRGGHPPPDAEARAGEDVHPRAAGQRLRCNECPYMKLNTLEKLYRCMAERSPELVMPESLRLAAYKPLKRMLDWS